MTSTGQLDNELAEPAETYDEEGRCFDQDGWHFDIDRYAWKRDGECWAPIGDTYKFIGWGVIPRGPNATGPDTRQEPTLKSTAEAARANRELWGIDFYTSTSPANIQGKWLEYHAKLLGGWPANEFYRVKRSTAGRGSVINIGRNVTGFKSGNRFDGPTRRFLEAHRNWKDGDEFPYFNATCIKDYMTNRTDGHADSKVSGRGKRQLQEFAEHFFPGHGNDFEFTDGTHFKVGLTAAARARGRTMAGNPSGHGGAGVASGGALEPGMDYASQSMWGNESGAQVIPDQQFYWPNIIDTPRHYLYQSWESGASAERSQNWPETSYDQQQSSSTQGHQPRSAGVPQTPGRTRW